MKKVLLIGGTMGIGKTTTSRTLHRALSNSVFLDGDWVWDMSPLTVTSETKNMAIDNICYLLNNFIKCSIIENVVFCWVMHKQIIIDRILAGIDLKSCSVTCISLICTKDELTRRFMSDVNKGIRKEENLCFSLHRLPLYNDLNTIKIDTTGRTPDDVVEIILHGSYIKGL